MQTLSRTISVVSAPSMIDWIYMASIITCSRCHTVYSSIGAAVIHWLYSNSLSYHLADVMDNNKIIRGKSL